MYTLFITMYKRRTIFRYIYKIGNYKSYLLELFKSNNFSVLIFNFYTY